MRLQTCTDNEYASEDNVEPAHLPFRNSNLFPEKRKLEVLKT